MNFSTNVLLSLFHRFLAFIKIRTNHKSFFGLPFTFIVICFICVLLLFLGIMHGVLVSEINLVSLDLRVAN
ncbi:MAG: hypothetical protein AAB530_01205, partial [Patescibacteria group bacterium]